jgi:hypothetical protein
MSFAGEIVRAKIRRDSRLRRMFAACAGPKIFRLWWETDR